MTEGLKKGLDYIGTTCVFFCHDGQGRFVLHRRSDKARDEQGRWDSGAGSLEFGETWEEAVRREVKEEYGAEPQKIQFAGVRNVIRNEGQKSHWTALVFAVLVDSSQVKINEPEKFTDLGWFTEETLPKPIHSQLLKHLDFVKKVW